MSRATYPECLLAIDPGPTTGWAVVYKGELFEVGITEEPPFGIISALNHMPNVALLEWYTGAATTKDAQDTMRLSGGFEVLIKMHVGAEIIRRAPTQRNPGMSRASGLLVPYARDLPALSTHIQDAVAHCITYSDRFEVKVSASEYLTIILPPGGKKRRGAAN